MSEKKAPGAKRGKGVERFRDPGRLRDAVVEWAWREARDRSPRRADGSTMWDDPDERARNLAYLTESVERLPTVNTGRGRQGFEPRTHVLIEHADPIRQRDGSIRYSRRDWWWIDRQPELDDLLVLVLLAGIYADAAPKSRIASARRGAANARFPSLSDGIDMQRKALRRARDRMTVPPG